MPIVKEEQVFRKPIDEVWAVLGDFGDTGKWSGRPKEDCTLQGRGVGALRKIALADGHMIVNRLDEQTRYSYSYSTISSPLPYKTYRAKMAVEAVDENSTRFVWTAEFEPLGIPDEQAVAMTRRLYRMGIDLMVQTIEGPSD
ncbi:MAG: SRPBCC family protein [Myxococcota bacterium]